MSSCCSSSPREVSPDTSTSIVWEGWGTSLAWFAHALGHGPSTRSTVAQLLFSKERGLGMNIVRYNIGGANQDHVQDYRPGGAIPCFARPDGSYDWDADAGQVALLLAAAQLGANIFEAFVNSPPYFWTISKSSRGHQHPLRSNLDKQHIHNFAKFCADVLDHFQAAHGITFQSFSPFNEPSSPAWCLAANCRQEACFFSRARAHKVIRALLQQPTLQRTCLVWFDQFCIRDTIGDLTHLPKDLRPAVGRVNTHTYNSSVFFSKLRAAPLVPFQDGTLARKRLRRLLARKFGGVSLWVSEFGTGRGALQLARHIVKDLATLLPSAWVYWQAVEDMGANWGLIEMPMQHPDGAAAGDAAAGTAAEAGPGCDAAGGVAAGAEGAAGCSRVPGAPAAAQDGEVSAVRAVSGSASSEGVQRQQQEQQQQLAQAMLHPNYFVVQFLMQALPVGSCLCRVEGFGKQGFAVWHPPGSATAADGGARWSLVFMNPNSEKIGFRVSASSFGAAHPTAATQGAAAQGQQAESAAVVVVGGAAISRVEKLSLHLLDVRGLVPQTVQGGLSRVQVAGQWQKGELELGVDGGCDVSVPPGHLCRVDGPSCWAAC